MFTTMDDGGNSILKDFDDTSFDENLAVKIYRTMLKLHITDSIFYEAQRQVRLYLEDSLF